MTKLLLPLLLILFLTSCQEDKCNRDVVDRNYFISAFDHCMNEAAKVSKAATHDNSYDLVHECQMFAYRIDRARCQEDGPTSTPYRGTTP